MVREGEHARLRAGARGKARGGGRARADGGARTHSSGHSHASEPALPVKLMSASGHAAHAYASAS